MNGRAVHYAKVELADGWHGWVYQRALNPLPVSLAGPLHLHAEEWQQIWPEIRQRALNAEPDDALKLSDSGHVVCITQTFARQKLALICKQSSPRGLGTRIRSLFSPSREWRSFVLGNRLLDAGVLTALPLAVLHRRQSGLWRVGVLITEAIPGAIELERALRVELPRMTGKPLFQTKSELCESIVNMLVGVRKLGLYHRDMKAPNLMVTGLNSDAEPARVWMIDLDGLRRRGRLSGKQLWQPLMRLNASLSGQTALTRTDRMRFLRAYLARMGPATMAVKGYWRMLEAWSASYRRKQAARQPWEGNVES